MEQLIKDDRPLYNSRIISTCIKFIKKNYSYVDVSELLRYAGMEPYQVEDEGHWFTQEQGDLFYEKMVELTGNRNIAREAGRFAASREAIGLMERYILGLVGPAKAYEMIGKYSSNFTRSTVFESKKLGPQKIEITVTPLEGIHERPYQCENRTGYIEAVALAFNSKITKIEHPECIFKGGKACCYKVSWQEFHSAFWKRIRDYVTILLSIICLIFYSQYAELTISTILPLSVFIVLSLTLYAGAVERRELISAINNLRESTDSLLDQIKESYNNALLINEVGQALSRQTDIDSVLISVIQVLRKRLDYDRGAIYLADEKKMHLIFRAGFGYTHEQLSILKNTVFHLDRPESRGVFAVSFRGQKPFLINNLDEIKGDLSPRSLEFAKKMKAKSFICCPIIYEEESLGILAVDNIKTKRPLVQSNINLLMGIAPEIGISIHNSMLIDARERQFKSILQVLASSIDARDPLTAGHSEKVTEYAVGICSELDLSKDYCEMIRVTSMLHDYGKIGIKDDILKKEDRLTIEEHDEIKKHVEKTKNILEKINFEGIYKEVPEIAWYHHEKFDGSGYPKGLRGEEIPLGARIIAVADFFEAITAKRHYRDAIPLDRAFQLLMDGSGKHFDENVVEAFIRYFQKKHHIAPETVLQRAKSKV
ncbi:MAG: HD domain-containing protein [Nitrospirota bacterium]|nr:HD domain-containing protein [Nitrospirota bacterium]